ncbi:hypothetical protein [Streptomyces labedae]|uniref:Uncharacterized protein n=1 Tax=Streptomyces labedae TaxID=285569 RepID=A0ABP6QZW7_9ACTN
MSTTDGNLIAAPCCTRISQATVAELFQEGGPKHGSQRGVERTFELGPGANVSSEIL